MNPLLTDIRAVFFDAVGTLIVPHPSAAEVYFGCASRRGLTISIREVGMRFREAFQSEEVYDSVTAWRCDDVREERRWRSIVGWVFQGRGSDAEIEGCFAELFAHFAQPSAWGIVAGAGELLVELAARGLTLGVASNFDRRLHAVLDGLPQLAPLHHRVISSEVGRRKPDPDFFAEVIRRAGCEPAEILFVGDRRENDVDGANAIGLRGVLLDGSSQTVPCVHRIQQLTDLL